MRKYLSIDCQETPSDLNGIRVDPSRILVRRMQVEAETDKSKPKTAALGSKLPNRPLDGVGGATTLLSPSGNVTLRWNFQFFSFSLGHFIFPSIPLFIHFFFGVLRRFPYPTGRWFHSARFFPGFVRAKKKKLNVDDQNISSKDAGGGGGEEGRVKAVSSFFPRFLQSPPQSKKKERNAFLLNEP